VVHRHLHRRRRHRLAATREPMGAHAADFLGGVGRRRLRDLAAKCAQRGLDILARDRHRDRFARRLSEAIVGIRRHAQPHLGLIALRIAGQEPREPRRLAEHERQHAGRHRIERAGVTDARYAQQPPHAGNDVVRGRTFGLVDDEEAVDVSGHR
jgi:hypothetical protein